MSHTDIYRKSAQIFIETLKFGDIFVKDFEDDFLI